MYSAWLGTRRILRRLTLKAYSNSTKWTTFIPAMSTKINAKIAFFGATGGCVNASLIRSLLARYDMGNLSQSSYPVWRTTSSPEIFCIPVTLDNPNICFSFTEALLNALWAIYTENPSTATSKPLFAFVFTTGISNGPEDVPFWFRFLYRVLVAVPGADKRKMESTLKLHMAQPEPASDFCAVSSGWKTLRVGTEDKPAVGYMIQRSDVGEWIFEEVVKKDGPEWAGKIVTLTSCMFPAMNCNFSLPKAYILYRSVKYFTC
ncbi:hypothetical protein POJ06DRAFT_293272 [Lipomyces tetrasporus]|uniref:Uncharacterized protein n=1 Tax=Lipomyces tetrasporus TaxID=54092 RepID=A0AAD7VR13_9ASCO|nr:uncharacterized protein POJ06DRAFT_293272 [Lipomyces tetrasporus]KAJ8098471.1 hypothetical protein POJ06DRAFT_293272 [Lipomyces tetrasporus]